MEENQEKSRLFTLLEGNARYIEIGHTKDERMHPHDGRYVPITDKRRLESIKTRIRGCEEDATALNGAPVYQQDTPADMVFSAAVWDKESGEPRILSLLA